MNGFTEIKTCVDGFANNSSASFATKSCRHKGVQRRFLSISMIDETKRSGSSVEYHKLASDAIVF